MSIYLARDFAKTNKDLKIQLEQVKILSAKSIEQENLKIIGVICPDIADSFFISLFKGVEEVCEIHDYFAIFCNTANSQEAEGKYIQKLFKGNVEGLIVVPAADDIPSVSVLQKHHFPIVIVDRKIKTEGISSVIADDEEGAYQATNYLLSLGHTKIVYLSGRKDVSTEIDRFSGYKKALADNHIKLQKDLILAGDFDWTTAYHAVDDFLQKQIEFTAIFFASDAMAFAAKEALNAHGLTMSEDISMIGYGDFPSSSTLSLTTVHQDPVAMGKQAILLLFDLIEKRITSPQNIVLKPSVIIRSSCRKID